MSRYNQINDNAIEDTFTRKIYVFGSPEEISALKKEKEKNKARPRSPFNINDGILSIITQIATVELLDKFMDPFDSKIANWGSEHLFL